MKVHQFNLLTKRRFLPLFITQFLGAFNDNVFKNAMIILITFELTQKALSTNTLVNLAAACFILPFFIFSATFGQLSDKFDKSRIARMSKILEIIIMLIATAALFLNNVGLLLTVLFLLGAQSTLFGPAKYAILPQHLEQYELVGGNALIESSTFVAILLGTLAGGILISLYPNGRLITAIVMLSIAVLGFIASCFIPRAASSAPEIPIDWNIFKAAHGNLKIAYKHRKVFFALLGISWFWFLGSLFFYQVGNYTKIVIGGGPHLATFLITLFAVGIGVGSLLCEKLSRRNIELGLVPLGAIGMSIFGLAIFFVQPHADTIHQTIVSFIQHGHNIALSICLFFFALFGGLYNVPLYAFIQDRSPASIRSRIISANNILNALFMVLSALFALILLNFGMTIPHLFLVAAILNIAITGFIFFEMPDFLMRFLVCLVSLLFYRIETRGTENLPKSGAVIFACNHVSFIDVVIMNAVSPRPIRFLMDWRLFNTPILKMISTMARAIPVAEKHESEKTKNQAFYRAVEAITSGEVVCIFPEGSITRDGQLGHFKYGIVKLVEQTHVTVIPMAVQGVWGSFFSRRYGKAMSHFPKRWRRSTVGLNIGKPIPYDQFSLTHLREEIQALSDELIPGIKAD